MIYFQENERIAFCAKNKKIYAENKDELQIRVQLIESGKKSTYDCFTVIRAAMKFLH